VSCKSRIITYLKLASIWRFWFFFFIYQRLVRLSYRGGGFGGSILAADEGTLFRRDDHPKGRQFARSSGHWKRRWRRGTTYTQHNNDWGYDVIIEYALEKNLTLDGGKKTTHIINNIREPTPTIEYKPYKWRGEVWCGDRRLFPQTMCIHICHIHNS